jgi:hypothetical protein
MLEEAYGKAAMKQTQIYEWHDRLRDISYTQVKTHEQ